MKYKMNLGRLAVAQSRRRTQSDETFRLAVLGDFSGRSNNGDVETGDALARRKPMRVDVDNLDDMISRLELKLHLPIGAGGATVEVGVDMIDDFHPDTLYEKLDLFSELSGLRQRLQNTATFAAAAEEVQAWAGEGTPATSTRPGRSGATTIPRGKLSDFARLVERHATSAAAATPVDELVKQVVGPHVVAAEDPTKEPLVAAVDAALSSAMRSVLHHPDFQAAEALWRSVDLLTRRLETSSQLQIVLYDITAEEIAADLSATDDLHETGLYQLLVEQPAMDQQQGSLTALVGNYVFERNPPHAELLGRIAKVATAAQAPFLAAISAEVFTKQDLNDPHPLIIESWSSLRDMPEAAYLGLAAPRFLLRWPYGPKTEPIDPFSFEEFTSQNGLRGMLWGNGAVLAGLLLAQTFSEQGLKSMELGAIMTLDDMPFYCYTDAYGDQAALPCTERVVTERVALQLVSEGFLPVLSIKGQPEVRLGSFASLGGPMLAGPWAPLEIDLVAEDDGGVESGDADVLDESNDSSDDVEEDESDDELEALLAGLDAEDEENEDEENEDEMDPGLAALLADL